MTFDIDANGIVHVTAKDLGTGKEQTIAITASSGLDKDEVEKMVHDAADHAEEDSKARELADVRNRADQMVYQVEKTLKENEGRSSPPKTGPASSRPSRRRARRSRKGDARRIKSGDRAPREGLAQAWPR